ncbi:MAG: D-alanyl-D-alanine carboxypeptidase [candidate division Zixibacteria bacterium]|nr:D-alanyl-D-alanine carboxypeptidase [candidate division Zixibacteria bacterium]
MKSKIKRFSVIKILVIIIMLWCVSASYSYYVSATSSPFNAGYFPNHNESLVSSFLNKIIPGRLGLKARAAIAVDAETGEVIFSKNKDMQLSIASLTKLAASLVFLSTNPDLHRPIVITKGDLNDSGRSRLYNGDHITLNDCLHLCLIRSDNAAVRALVRSTGLGEAEFVSLMNDLADSLNMNDTHFADPTGRYAKNMSTAADLVKLIQAACNNEIIADISSKKIYQYKPFNRKYTTTLYNTNRLLFSKWKINGGKTGYISRAGYCLAIDADNGFGKHVNAVILGSPSNNYRFRDAERLLAYALKN